MARHPTTDEIERGLDDVRAAPTGEGRVVLVVARPAPGERRVLDVGTLDETVGLVGDCWFDEERRATPGSTPDPGTQLTLVNDRAARLIAGDDPRRRALFGDQLHVDLDLSEAHLPPGTSLAVGAAVIRITDVPHRGCLTFREHFGSDALRAVNTDEGMALHLRGLNARVVVGGAVRPGDRIRRLVLAEEGGPGPAADRDDVDWR